MKAYFMVNRKVNRKVNPQLSIFFLVNRSKPIVNRKVNRKKGLINLAINYIRSFSKLCNRFFVFSPRDFFLLTMQI